MLSYTWDSTLKIIPGTILFRWCQKLNNFPKVVQGLLQGRGIHAEFQLQANLPITIPSTREFSAKEDRCNHTLCKETFLEDFT